MKTVYVLMNYGSSPEDLPYTIGVFDSLREANSGIYKYFGYHNLLSFKDIRDSGVEFIKTIEVSEEIFDVQVLYFNINEV